MPNDNSTMGERFDERYDICNNPDHGFIYNMGYGDIGRLGCPGCGGKFDEPKLFTPSDLKQFIHSEISRAVGEREKELSWSIWGEIVKIADDYTGDLNCHLDDIHEIIFAKEK